MALQLNSISGFTKALVPSEFTKLLDIGNERYCRYLWSKQINKKQTPAWQAIGQRQTGKPVTSILDFKMKAEGRIAATGDRKCSVDVYVSPNQFFDWRNTKQLAQLHANWLEIDTIGHAVLDEVQQAELAQCVFSTIERCGLPPPTAYVASGSGGLHVYWIYDGVEAFKWRIRIWREITLTLAKALKRAKPDGAHWCVDFSASRDPARVLRLPGTFHGTSGQLVDAYIGGPIYTFQELAGGLVSSPQNVAALLDGRAPSNPVKHPKAPNTAATAQRATPSGKHTIGQWWFRIYSEVCTTARRTGVREGQRDLYAFVLFVALKHVKANVDEAIERIVALNEEFIHLQKDELLRYLSSAINKHYKYRKDTIAEYLDSIGVSSAFLFESEKPPLPKDEIKRRQSRASMATAASRRTRTFEALKAALQQITKTRLNVTQSAIAALAKRSIRTVRRYWNVLQAETLYTGH